jgi:tetratricopeptide (TPR) repeat protein
MSLLDSIKIIAGKIGSGGSRAQGPATGAECPHEADALAYSENRLSERRREQLESHFVGCDDCRDFLALYARHSNDEAETELEPLADSEIKNQAARIITYIKEDEFRHRSRASAGFFVSTRQLVTAGLILCAMAAATIYFVTRGEPKNEVAMQALALATKEERRIEPRLSGGLPHSSYPFVTRGAVADEDPQSDVQFDRAQAEMQFAESPSASAKDRQTLARVWLARGEADYTRRALAILEQLVAAGNQSPDLLNDTGVAMLQLGRHNEAINYFNQALAKSPGFNEALFNKAIAEQKAGSVAEAREDWKKFIETSSDEKWKDEARRRLKAIESETRR